MPVGEACVAVGTDRGLVAVALGWNGLAWTNRLVLGTPLRGPGYDLPTVSCATPDFCVAGGARYGKRRPGILGIWARWNGARWTTPSSTAVVHSHGVTGVSCASPTDCTAVAGGVFTRAAVEHWNGSRWSRESFHGSSDDVFLSISCPAGSRCVAVGALVAGAKKPDRPLVAVSP